MKTIQIETELKRNRNTIYDAVYDTLVFMNTKCTYPITKYKMTTNKNVMKLIIEKEFVKEVTDKNELLTAKHVEVPHYVISSKGCEYIRRYRDLMELVDPL